MKKLSSMNFYFVFRIIVAAVAVLGEEAISAPANQFTLTLSTDDYSSLDNAWALYLISNNPPTLIASKDIGAYGDNKLYAENYSLADGQYQFNLTDKYGDGLLSPGYFTISLGGIVFKNGGDFLFIDSTTFNVPIPANQFTFQIRTDGYSSIDNAWTLYLISKVPPQLVASKTIGSYGDNRLYTENYILESGKYQFNLTDKYGDGLLSLGYYTFSLGGVVLKNGGVFTFLDSTTFVVGSVPNKPASSKPVTAKPVALKPAPSAVPKPTPAATPVLKKPAPAKPTPAKPSPTKPAPTKPAPAKPSPTKPAPAKPKPAKPTLAKPVAKPPPKPLSKPVTSPVQQQQLFDRYLVIVLENQDYSTVMGEPYFQNLATKGTLFTSFYALTHPSYPNYLGMVAGSYFGISSNTQVNLQQKSIADLLEAKGLSWKNYAEDYPGNCYLGSTAASGLYARKHVPFLSFQSIQNDATRCNYVVPASTFQNDWNSRKLPTYSFYTPNMDNDGHDTSVPFSAAWLQSFLDPLLADSVGMKGTLIHITYDEGVGANKIYNLFIGPMIKVNQKITTTYDHYSVLKTIEYNFNLGSLGQQDSTAKVIQELWA